MGFKEWIIPQDKVFFDLMASESQLVVEAAEAFKSMLEDYSNLEQKTAKIRELEHACDEVLHEIYAKLNRSFIAPFDHEDISKLVSLYDDVLDLIDSVANKLHLFKIESPDDIMVKSSQIILQMCKEVDSALRQIRKIKEQQIRKTFVKVHVLENEMDDLIDNAMARLFKLKDAVRIIILKDLYETLELITDKCEDVCLIIQDIVIKNA
jgi:predicted phosphate transport protein (TIGR00153 family)